MPGPSYRYALFRLHGTVDTLSEYRDSSLADRLREQTTSGLGRLVPFEALEDQERNGQDEEVLATKVSENLLISPRGTV